MEWFEDWLGNPYLEALALVVVSILVGALADRLLGQVLKRWAKSTRTQFDDRLVDLLHGPVVKTIVLWGLRSAYHHVDRSRPAVEATKGLDPAVLVDRTVGSLILILWTIFAFRAVALLLRSATASSEVRVVEERTFPLFDNISKALVFALALWCFIAIWHVDPSPWLASAGVAGIALGFAAKDTLSNFFAGIFIIADAPYRVGDYVNLTNGQRGRVERIGLRSTRILTRDDVEITIPNAIIGNAPIVNESAGPSPAHRIRIRVSVAYGTDLEPMRKVLLSVALEHEHVCKDPEPRVRFREFGDSGLNHELLCWIPQPELRGIVIHELNTLVHDRFAAAGIEIPFPKRDLYVKQWPGSPGNEPEPTQPQ